MSQLSFVNLNPDQTWLLGNDQFETLTPLLAQAQFLGQYFNQHDIKTCALNDPDLSTFATVFLACVYHGVDIELPSNTTEDIIDSLTASCYLGDFEHNHNAILNDIEQAIVPHTQAPLKAHDITVSLFTSGSTGQPKKISRNLQQLVSEVNTLEQQWGASIPQEALFTRTVSYQHIYGLLFTVLWPLLSGRRSYQPIIAYEEILHQLSAKYSNIALITSPAFLKRLDVKLRYPRVALSCFSSGGLLTDKQQQLAERHLNHPIIQIYGSSETGGIAYRKLNTRWRFFDPVEHQYKNDTLWVKSPHCFKPEWINTQDQIKFDPESTDSFELLGRADRIVKIEEKRISLAQVEMAISALEYVSEAKVLVWENHRQSIAAVILLNTEGTEQLKTKGGKLFKTKIKQQLKGTIDDMASPRYIRFVDQMPTDALGKSPIRLLEALFE